MTPMPKKRRLDPKRAPALVGSGAAIAALLAAGILVANALAAKPVGRGHKPGTTTTSTTTSTTVPTSGKVTICHRTHSATNPGVTITVNVHAWKAHQRHGDTLGACPTTTTTTTTTTPTTSTTTTTTASRESGGSGNAPGNSGNAPGHNKR